MKALGASTDSNIGSIGFSPLMEQKGMDVEEKRKCTEEEKKGSLRKQKFSRSN